MSNMRRIRFSDFVTLQRGFDLPKNQMLEGPYPVIGSTSIIGHHNAFKVEPPGVITGRSGSLGIVQYVDKPYWPHNTALWVKDFKGNNPLYVYFFFKTIDFSRFNSGVGVPTLNRNHLDGLEIEVHGFDEQRKIANILSAYDNLIENNSRRIQILEEISQKIYREWFVNFRFPGYEHVSMVESEIGLIPERWEVTRIEDKFTTVLGGTPSRQSPLYWENGIIPWINSGKVNELRILEPSEFITEDALAKSATKLMPKHTTVIAITGATLGQVSYLEIESCANQSVVGIVDKTEVFSEWIYLTMTHRIEEIIMFASGGAQQHINKEIINNVKILIPSEEVIDNFHVLVYPLFQFVSALLHTNINLQKQRNLLLPKLISGELIIKVN